ncbi:hypothetical protein M422DRAFT_241399 [Sphaerobolus stellatus SS14]|nr:hypothetical protein M422DRAFT_241399 [Sphaerobolus stellatus SS14]
MLMDEKVYGPDVDKFSPERFFQPGSSPVSQFGFVEGRYFAEKTLFIGAATILKLFDITPAKDAHGNDIPITGEYSQAVIVPMPFQCSIKPPLALAEKLILEASACKS